jgi:putative ABC transport system permease protein
MQVTVRVVTQGIRSFTTLPFIFANLPLARTLVDASVGQATYTLVQVAPGADVEQVRKSLQARLPTRGAHPRRISPTQPRLLAV